MNVRAMGRRTVGVGVWLIGLGAVLWAMHRLGHGALSTPPLTDRSALQRWTTDRDPVTIGFALLRLVALATAWYLVAVTVLGALARASRLPRLVALSDLATLPPVRRLLGGVFGLGLTAAAGTIVGVPLSVGPSAPRSRADGMAVVMERTDDRVVVMTAEPQADDDHDDDDDQGTASMWVLGPDAPASDPTAWTVAPGDSLWSLAEAQLTASLDRPVSDAEVERYWRRVLDENRSRLADPANPDLIFAGQVFAIPPVPNAPGR